MRPPFPGMDPWLEHPAIWPDVHNRLIAAIADAMSPVIAPKYYIGVKNRTDILTGDDLAFIGVPDLAVSTTQPARPFGPLEPMAGVAVEEVEIPMAQEVRETYLEVRAVKTRTLVTLIEVLSPVNKLSKQGRLRYERKRSRVFDSLTNLVEIDLLRAGQPMPWQRGRVTSDYRIFVSPGQLRPKARLYAFGVRSPIPSIPLPLLPGDDEPPMDLGAILHALYDRARFDLLLDYGAPPEPPLNDADAEWARGIIREGMA